MRTLNINNCQPSSFELTPLGTANPTSRCYRHLLPILTKLLRSHPFTMLTTSLYVLSLGALAAAQSSSTTAPVVNSNPLGASFVANLQANEAAGKTLKGSITGTSGPNGTGVLWAVSLSGLPATGGPFSKSEILSRAQSSLADGCSVSHP